MSILLTQILKNHTVMTIEELRKNLPKLTEQELQFCMFLMNKDKIQEENRKKDKLTGIDRKFKEAEIEADYNDMSDYYENNPLW